jgi:Ser/Thr protein kinase RdoA (MazF antagonist)
MSLEHSSPADPAPSNQVLATIDDILRRIGRVRTGGPLRIPSARNENYRVPTRTGLLFFRFHRHTRGRERIELNLAAMAHAAHRGIPVVQPIADREGNVLFPGGGRLASVYQWVDASSYERGGISAPQAAAIGAVHGRLHIALGDFTHPSLAPSTEVSWDREQSIAVLSRVDDLIRYYPAPGEEQLRIQQGLRFQLAVLESDFPRPDTEFASLPRQAIHGDIHEGNVLMAADGSVAAVVDWDMASLAPPLYEVFRALDFARALDDNATRDAYLGAYAARAPYLRSIVELAIDLWIQSVVHNTWVYRARFIEGDRGVTDQFLAAKPMRVRQFTDPAYRDRLLEHFLCFAS